MSFTLTLPNTMYQFPSHPACSSLIVSLESITLVTEVLHLPDHSQFTFHSGGEFTYRIKCPLELEMLSRYSYTLDDLAPLTTARHALSVRIREDLVTAWLTYLESAP